MAVLRACVLVDLGTPATLAAANATLAAAVAALPANMLPESCENLDSFVVTGAAADRKAGVMLICGDAPFQDWLAVTASAVVLVPIQGNATVAAVNAAIAAELTTQDGAGMQLRTARKITIAIAGRPVDCVALVFSDGAPATS